MARSTAETVFKDESPSAVTLPDLIPLFALAFLMGLVGVGVYAAGDIREAASGEGSLVDEVSTKLDVAASLAAACEADWGDDERVARLSLAVTGPSGWTPVLYGARDAPLPDATDAHEAVALAAWSMESHSVVTLDAGGAEPLKGIASCDTVELGLPGDAGRLTLQASPGFVHLSSHDGACPKQLLSETGAAGRTGVLFDTTLEEGGSATVVVRAAAPPPGGEVPSCPLTSVHVSFDDLWTPP